MKGTRGIVDIDDRSAAANDDVKPALTLPRSHVIRPTFSGINQRPRSCSSCLFGYSISLVDTQVHLSDIERITSPSSGT